MDCTYILVYYDREGACQDIETRQLSLPANGTVNIPPPDGTRRFGQFLCQTDTAVPLAPARKSF